MNVVVFFLLALSCAAAVVWPLLRAASSESAARPERVEALEERDRALAALRELEFDHRAGTITDDDYRALVRTLRLRAAEALRRVDGDA